MNPPSDWELKKCLRLSLAVLLATLGLAGLAGLGIDIPILRLVAGFILLTFVPGILLLRILKVHDLSPIESLLYSVGLSIAFVMFSGLLINAILPLVGVNRPISTLPVMVTQGVSAIVLMIIAYIRDRKYSSTSRETKLDLVKVFSPPVLLIFLVLLITILGALMVNFYRNNVLLLAFILIVAAVVGLAAFGKFITPQIYPLALTIIALCLLYQTTLISPYLTGTDLHGEYYFEQLTINNGFWDPNIPHAYTSALSITLLAPIYSLVLDVDGAWLFKLVFPFFFSLVPLALSA